MILFHISLPVDNELEKTGKKKDGVENRATARIIDMELLQTDPRKRSFDESVARHSKKIKSEKDGNSLDSVTLLKPGFYNRGLARKISKPGSSDVLTFSSIVNSSIVDG